MKCPNCNVNLLITERQGTEIDYCPECRGVWLERGKLDKIIEKSTATTPPGQQQPEYYADHHGHDHDHDEDHGRHGSHGRRRGWLSELFD